MSSMISHKFPWQPMAILRQPEVHLGHLVLHDNVDVDVLFSYVALGRYFELVVARIQLGGDMPYKH